MMCSACNEAVRSSGINHDGNFCGGCGRALTAAAASVRRSTLVRPRYGRMIGGVCAGFAQEYGWDVTLVRLLVCLTVLLGAGSPVVLYVAAWIIMPNEPWLLAAQPVAQAGVSAS